MSAFFSYCVIENWNWKMRPSSKIRSSGNISKWWWSLFTRESQLGFRNETILLMGISSSSLAPWKYMVLSFHKEKSWPLVWTTSGSLFVYLEWLIAFIAALVSQLCNEENYTVKKFFLDGIKSSTMSCFILLYILSAPIIIAFYWLTPWKTLRLIITKPFLYIVNFVLIYT